MSFPDSISTPFSSLSLSSPPPPPSHPLTPTKPTASPSPQQNHQTPMTMMAERQWRPAAQRNIRNQWSRLAAACRHDWGNCSGEGRGQASGLVNSLLSQKYMDVMDLGVLSDMPNIRNEARHKLRKQQELYKRGILSSYKRMAAILVQMINTSRSMKCFSQGAKSYSLLQFSTSSDDKSDTGDGGGIPVFTFLSVSAFEELAQELRFLVVELLSASCVKAEAANRLFWSDELYQGETDDLRICSLYVEETAKPIMPRLLGWKSVADAIQSNYQPNREVLQVYLTTWLGDVNLDTRRVDEIFSIVGEEMHTSFL
ncbi:hypothetical protein AKJ16_DCAP06096 [Drosera capensis]